MAEIIDSQERAWIAKLTNEGGIVSLDQSFISTESWERYIKNSGGVLQYPPNLGYDAELQNYVLFDIYEVLGQNLLPKIAPNQNPPKEKVKLKGTQRKDIEKTSEEISGNIGKAFDSKINADQLTGVIGDTFAETVTVLDPESGMDEEQRNVYREQVERSRSSGTGLESANSLSLGFGGNKSRVNLSIALPMPAQLNSNYGFDYEDVDYTGLMNLISAKNVIQKMAVDGQEVDAEAKEVLRKIASIPTGIVDSLSNIFGSDSVNAVDALNMRRAQAPNRYKEQTFKGVTRRSFSFEWELSPRSREDALRIYSIVYAFKKYAHPSRTEGGLYLNYPAQFKIGFYTRSELNDFLFRIALCGCTKCEVTYGGEDLSFFRDFLATSEPFSRQSSFAGSPANTIKLSLEFTELELLTQERIQQGY
jgi:hypothetical protein